MFAFANMLIFTRNGFIILEIFFSTLARLVLLYCKVITEQIRRHHLSFIQIH